MDEETEKTQREWSCELLGQVLGRAEKAAWAKDLWLVDNLLTIAARLHEIAEQEKP